MKEQSGQAEPSEFWQLPSKEERGDDGRRRGGGEQTRLREIKGALIKGLSLLLFDRGGEVEKEGFNEKSMMMRTETL